MTSQQAALYRAMVQIWRSFMTTGGPSFTGERRTGDGITAARTSASLSARTLHFIPARLESLQRAMPEVVVWNCDWLVFDSSTTDVQAEDVYTDGTFTYIVTAQPISYYGFLLGPANLYAGAVAASVDSFLLLETGDFLLLETGDKVLLEA